MTASENSPGRPHQEPKIRVAFQGEPGAFSEAAAVQLLGEAISTVPRPTFDAAFGAIADGLADALLAPVENTLAGPVVRVYDLLLESTLTIVAETILPIEHQLIGCPGATLDGIRSVASHPMALAQCERFFATHPDVRRVPAEDTAGSVREALARGDKSAAAIAGRRAAVHYSAVILASDIQDNPENFTRFVLLVPAERNDAKPLELPDPSAAASPAVAQILASFRATQAHPPSAPSLLKMSLALRLAHKPGALLAALEPFSRLGINLQKIESRPIHGRPWEYQFFLDVETDSASLLQSALAALRPATSQLRPLGLYPPAARTSASRPATPPELNERSQ